MTDTTRHESFGDGVEQQDGDNPTLVVVAQDVHLTKYDSACRALAEAKSVDEVKEIRNQAVAMAAYAKQAKNREMEADAVEIRVRAEHHLGQFMRAQAETFGKAKGAAEPGTNRGTTRVSEKPASLDEAGIDKNLAHRAPKSAELSEEEFEDRIDEMRRGDRGQLDIRRAPKRVRRPDKPVATVVVHDDGNDAPEHAEQTPQDSRTSFPARADQVSDQPRGQGAAQREGLEQHSLTVSLSAVEFDQVAALAKRQGIPADAVVRCAVADYVAKFLPQEPQT